MDIDKCNFCGSNKLRWDYKNGIIVCEDCGTVIDDKIFDGTSPFLETKIKPSNYLEKSKERELKQRTIRSYEYINSRKSINKVDNLYLKSLFNFDRELYFTYLKLLENGILSGKKIKTRIIITIFFSNRREEYEKYLRYFNITEKEYKDTLSHLKLKAKIKIIDKLVL
ncbi:TFIIB-type zinc ribbon-containing protein [Sulfuracidifex tepidarius]|uniref:TFIIB-type domain-containing protein n=1 Tax=Sulfuracidifex tepidarius TaxID=1294262 RepID=A0A510E3X5_9CREN|nr:TFIIB-type zinc ribbon-containing protein [Sulfuracidifex tepidarius]BBG24456.1 hypothetical protein IC006_1775 [Sulfuracidifex tepidarius]BBG27214.1 hypothetical protein IC007_1753 [Sulfuracidifex tepidarius]